MAEYKYHITWYKIYYNQGKNVKYNILQLTEILISLKGMMESQYMFSCCELFFVLKSFKSIFWWIL